MSTLFRLIVAVTLFAAPAVSSAQSAGEVRRIGYLTTSLTASPHFVDALRQGLRELGWVEGRNLVIEYRSADGKDDRLPGLAAELVKLKPELIVAAPTVASVAARNATATIPIVMVSVGDPVRLGLVASLARPGGNATGTSFDVGLEVYAKELELLKEALPKTRRVAVLSNAGHPAEAFAVENVKAAAKSLRLELQLLPVRDPRDFAAAFEAMKKERADALLVVSDPMFNRNRVQLADLAAKSRIPAMYGFSEFVDAGGLMSYGPNVSDLFRRAATFIDRILKGAKPADLPVEQPRKFELVINLKTAKALGLTIPPSLLLRADQVLE